MLIFKKSMMAALAIATTATAGTAFTTTSANAHYKTYQPQNCYYKQVWRTNYYGHRYRKTIKICY